MPIFVYGRLRTGWGVKITVVMGSAIILWACNTQPLFLPGEARALWERESKAFSTASADGQWISNDTYQIPNDLHMQSSAVPIVDE